MVTKIVLTVLALRICTLAQNVDEKFYDQKLDHFNGIPGIWKQRYLENKEFYKPRGPIFLLLGGPAYAPITEKVLQKGSMIQYAKEQGAHLVALEMRYYGESRPTKDMSTQNLKRFHTSAQIVEDTSSFLRWLKTQPQFLNTKVVGFGSGLVGTRLLYVMKSQPGLIDIMVASSTPVEAKFEIPEYVGKGVEVLKRMDQECYESVHDGILCLANIAKGKTCQGQNLTTVRSLLNLCDDMDTSNSLNLGGVVAEVVKNIGGVILLNNPDPRFPYNVPKMCVALADQSKGGHLERLAGEIKKISAIRRLPCLETRFERSIERLQNTAWDTPTATSGERATLFSRCSEAALIRSLDSLDLGDRANKLVVTYFLEQCKRLFDLTEEEVRGNVKKTNEKFMNRVLPGQCGIFVSGGDDLFSPSAVRSQQEAGTCNRNIIIEGSSFARDRYDILPQGMSYPPALRTAQLQIGKLIDGWLKTGNCCVPTAKRAIEAERQIYDVL